MEVGFGGRSKKPPGIDWIAPGWRFSGGSW